MEPPESANRRVLIVDDQVEIHDDFDEILASESIDPAIRALGDAFSPRPDENRLPRFELSHAMDGAAACDMVRAAREARDPFALAYVDVRMPPGMDGIETIRRIREFEQELEVVIMTATATSRCPKSSRTWPCCTNCSTSENLLRAKRFSRSRGPWWKSGISNGCWLTACES